MVVSDYLFLYELYYVYHILYGDCRSTSFQDLDSHCIASVLYRSIVFESTRIEYRVSYPVRFPFRSWNSRISYLIRFAEAEKRECGKVDKSSRCVCIELWVSSDFRYGKRLANGSGCFKYADTVDYVFRCSGNVSALLALFIIL